jgi:Zinc finger, C3HC4 type (RING finger)
MVMMEGSHDALSSQSQLCPNEPNEYSQFSSIEQRFYERQLERTLQLAGDIPKNATRPGSTNGSLEVLARELHNLRAACCHPQVGSSGLTVTKRYRAAAGSRRGVNVLTMDQVLDRLIDDAKNQCEEALRVAIFHSNPMAAIVRLKVAAKNEHGIQGIPESDEVLISQSCKLYQDVLDLVDNKAAPSLATGEALVCGSPGFRSPQVIVRGGSFLLEWQLHAAVECEKRGSAGKSVLWASFDYECQPKKVRQIRVRAKTDLPSECQKEGACSWTVQYPKDCALQVANGDEFVDICSFALPPPNFEDDTESRWVVQGGLWVQKSKNWRIVVRSFHGDTGKSHCPNQYVGVDLELYEPTIASDSLPRLHALHNAIVSFREMKDATNSTTPRSDLPMSLSRTQTDEKIRYMQSEITQIENHHLGYAKCARQECLRRLKALWTTRCSLEKELVGLWDPTGREKPNGFWNVTWWEDVLAAVTLRGSPIEQQSLCQKAAEAIEQCKLYYSGDRQDSFPDFQDLNGFHVALKLRLGEILEGAIDGKYHDAIQGTLKLSPTPTRAEIMENRSCRFCKADWYQTGDKCRHCILEEGLVKLQSEKQKLVRYILDGILKWLKSNRTGVRNTRVLKAAAAVGTKFFEVYDVATKEVLAAKRLWRVHLDFMNVIDELDTCKTTTMRLVHNGEDLSDISEEKRNSLLVPIDVNTKYEEHSFKLSSALGQLRRHEHNLQFLKNQGESQAKQCAICLSPFKGDRAVLACGHSFCPPCVERLKKCGHIKCPNRCSVRTNADEVFLASNERNDDGSRCHRQVKGSWGTKVAAIVSDLLVISDKGEKSIVFSMWEDMLDILQEALTENKVEFVRASRLVKIGDAASKFRSSDCSVLLLNVKNGAEGLNLVEATHVIMIEPLLNCGMDSQGMCFLDDGSRASLRGYNY